MCSFERVFDWDNEDLIIVGDSFIILIFVLLEPCREGGT